MTIMTKGVVRVRLSEILEELDLTQIRFSLDSGLSANAVSKLTGHPRQIRLDTLATLVENTGKPLSEILVYEPGDGSESS